MSNSLTGWNRFAPARHLECILLCVGVPACMHLFDADRWRAVTHRKEGCQYAPPPLPCSLSALRSAQRWCRGCVCVCVGCVSMSLLWSEMTLRSAAILPTVNIIQYHPTGINMVVLLLAEMCCCSSFLSQQHFLAPTRFLLGGCVRWWLMIQIYRKKGWAAVLSSGSVVSRVSFCTCTRVRLLDYSVYPSPSPHLHNVCLTKRANMAGVDSSAWVIIKCALSFSIPFLLFFIFFFLFPSSLVWLTLMRWRVARANDRHEHGWNVRPNVKSTWSSAWPMSMNYEYSPPE